MLHKYLIATATIVALTLPAFAATTYYVAQDTKTMTCKVVTKKPDGAKLVQIGTDTYKTKKLATTAMGAAPECKKPKA
jgi:hypothetical protein